MHTNLTRPEDRSSCELNIGSIFALDNQIEELEKALAELKRTRNSLLDVHKLPPEIFGKIFRWNVTFEGDFGGLEKRSHNFMFVCHHWYEVALRTPRLWSFWGNTPEDWVRWYPLSATAPLDLVLSGIDRYCRFDPTLSNALQDRACRDTVRRIHLRSENSELLESILSSLTPGCKDTRSNRMKSLFVRNCDETPVDGSDFFAHHCFPKLQRLNLIHCTISSWDLLKSRTGALTELHLDFLDPSPTPTTLQLLSILASNPGLREVTLLHQAVPDDQADTSFAHHSITSGSSICLESRNTSLGFSSNWTTPPLSTSSGSLYQIAETRTFLK